MPASNLIFPVGTTDVTAPVHHHLGCHVKRGMQVRWQRELAFNYRWKEGDDRLFGKHATYRRIMAQWCQDSWLETLTHPVLVRNAFVHTGFLSKMDGSDKHLLQVKGCDH